MHGVGSMAELVCTGEKITFIILCGPEVQAENGECSHSPAT